MPSVNYNVTIAGNGLNIQKSLTRTQDGAIGIAVSIPAAKVGQLTTRTDNTTGTLTMVAGHGLTTALKVDLYWSGGSRIGVTLGTVSTNSVPISGGTGTNLPTNLTAVTVSPQVTILQTIDGDALGFLGMVMGYADNSITDVSHVGFWDVGDASVASLDLTAGQVRVWDITGGDANAFTGNVITYLKASNKSSAAAATLTLIGAQDVST